MNKVDSVNCSEFCFILYVNFVQSFVQYGAGADILVKMYVVYSVEMAYVSSVIIVTYYEDS